MITDLDEFMKWLELHDFYWYAVKNSWFDCNHKPVKKEDIIMQYLSTKVIDN